MNKLETDARDLLQWVSLILRLSVASLLLAASITRLLAGFAGINANVLHFHELLDETWLPSSLVNLYGHMTPLIEVLLGAWLLLGYRLRAAWVVIALYLTSLGFGMVVAEQYEIASHNYSYVLIACVGLYVGRFDRFRIDRFLRGKD